MTTQNFNNSRFVRRADRITRFLNSTVTVAGFTIATLALLIVAPYLP